MATFDQAKFRKIVAEELEVDEAKVVPDAKFAEDLGADSLDMVELVIQMEEVFDVDLPQEEADKITTVGDAETLIAQKLAAA